MVPGCFNGMVGRLAAENGKTNTTRFQLISLGPQHTLSPLLFALSSIPYSFESYIFLLHNTHLTSSLH